MKLKKLSILAAVAAAAVLAVFPVQASSVINTVPQTVQAESGVTAKNAVTYFGSEVLEAYTYNPQKYTYHKITDSKQLSLLMKLLESGKTKAPKGAKEGGFLLVTKNGKHEIYIDSQEKELLTLCKNNNAASPGRVQWLVFMSADKITEMSYSGSVSKAWGFRTDERWALSEAASLLKSLKVDETKRITTQPEDHKNPPTGGKPLLLEFNTGVSYRIDFGDNGEDSLSIRSTDMGYSVTYFLQKGECDRLQKGLKDISQKNPTYILSLPMKLKTEEIASVSAYGYLGESSFSIDTSVPYKIKRLCESLQAMRVYGVGKYMAEEMNFNTPSGDGCYIRIIKRDGSEDFIHIYAEEMTILHSNSSYYGYHFTKEDFRSLYQELTKIV